MNEHVGFEQAVEQLEARGIMPERPPSLDPTIEGLRRLDLDTGHASELRTRTIVVAGTNGKGSVCAALESIFLAQGERVGLYTSPHLVDYTERIRLGGADISHELFLEAYCAVDGRTTGLKLTHFEMLTLMAAWIFYSGRLVPPCERVILEVGLGGLWDATNAVPHDTAVITSLGHDHQNLLGKTLAEIAINKLGIIEPKCRLIVHAPFAAEVGEVVAKTKARSGGRWVERLAFRHRVDSSGSAPKWFLSVDGAEGEIAFAGLRGAENAALALTVARELGIDVQDAISALSDTRWPGRMDQAGHAPSGAPIYWSGDHNPQGVASLLELLPHFKRRRLHLVVGVGADKDLDGILGPLFALPDAKIYLTETPFRGRSIDAYGDWRARAQFSSAVPMTALRAALDAAEPDDLVLVTGSLYLVGRLRAEALRDS